MLQISNLILYGQFALQYMAVSLKGETSEGNRRHGGWKRNYLMCSRGTDMKKIFCKRHASM